MEWYRLLKLLEDIKLLFFTDRKTAYIKLVLLIDTLKKEEADMEKYYEHDMVNNNNNHSK